MRACVSAAVCRVRIATRWLSSSAQPARSILGNETASTGFLRTNTALWNLYHKFAQDEETFARKMRARELLQERMDKHISPLEWRLLPIGSTMSGDAKRDSDLDMCILTDDPTLTDRKYAAGCLKKIKSLVVSADMQSIVREFDLFAVAQVPIIRLRMQGAFEGLVVDMNVNHTEAVRHSHLLHHYSRLDERVGALSFLIKHWAKLSRINNTFEGSLGSFPLSLMVVHYLQCGMASPVLPNLQSAFPHIFSDELSVRDLDYTETLELSDHALNDVSLTEILTGFFRYYAEFDFEKQAVSVRRGEAVQRSDLIKAYDPRCPLVIEDPFTGLNVASGVDERRAGKRVRPALSHAASVSSTSRARENFFNSLVYRE